MRSEGQGFTLRGRLALCVVTLTVIVPAFRLGAQSQNGGHRQPPMEVPLQLLVAGSGQVTPLKNGQMLLVGSSHVMTAVPDRGHQFLGWRRMNVFTFLETVYDDMGNPSTISSTVDAPTPEMILKRSLEFQVDQPEVILDVPGVRTIIRTTGWQANFTGPG